MTIEDRRARERAARRQLITATARTLAEQEGWDAVTTRRLSTEIEYSQPVLYKHFSGMEDIVASVAVQGFAELGGALAAARGGATPQRAAARPTAGTRWPELPTPSSGLPATTRRCSTRCSSGRRRCHSPPRTRRRSLTRRSPNCARRWTWSRVSGIPTR